MNRIRLFLLTLGALALMAPAAWAQRHDELNVEVWTDRGNDAVYQPGDAMEVRVRTSDDAYLLVYEIDSEGHVRLLYPEQGIRGFVAGRETQRVPSPRSNLELVVEGPVGQGFIVAVASREPFRAMPWYLRPYDPHAEGVGYSEEPREEEGVTSDGLIVGDPFVAMERIRRRVTIDPENAFAFGTAYTSYYVHHEVRYPRYLCNDCHRPNQWAWWDDFDPYYARCSVFDFRVNWGWCWGPSYWFGSVPYYYYAYRPDCPPRYRVFTTRSAYYSSWDGWRRWNSLWGGNLRRFKSPPPPGYTPPSRFDDRVRAAQGPPPGFFNRQVARGRHAGLVPVIRGDERTPVGRGLEGDRQRQGGRPLLRGASRAVPEGRGSPAVDTERAPRQWGRGGGDGRLARPAPRQEPPKIEKLPDRGRETPRWEKPRDRRDTAPRREAPADRGRSGPREKDSSTGKSDRGKSGKDG